MKLITWNVQWCRGVDQKVDPARVDRRREAHRRLRRPVPAGDRGQLSRSAARRKPGRGPVRHPRRAAARLHGDCGRGRRSAGRRRQAAALRQPDPVAAACVAGVSVTTLPYPADHDVPSMPRVAVEAVVSADIGDVRVITTHLEYYSQRKRAAQLEALRSIYAEGQGYADNPRTSVTDEGPYQAFARPAATIVTGDFNLEPDDPLHARMVAAFDDGTPPLFDAWQAAHPGMPHPPTFHIYEKKQPGDPEMHCDFIFVSDVLRPRIAEIMVDTGTQVSDHQPVLICRRCASCAIRFGAITPRPSFISRWRTSGRSGSARKTSPSIRSSASSGSASLTTETGPSRTASWSVHCDQALRAEAPAPVPGLRHGALFRSGHRAVLAARRPAGGRSMPANVVLTPHQTKPEQTLERIVDNEICSLKYGIFNLGFIGVRGDRGGQALRRLVGRAPTIFCWADSRTACSPTRNGSTTRRCSSTASPSSRSPRFNVATWNLTTRALTGEPATRRQVDGRAAGLLPLHRLRQRRAPDHGEQERSGRARGAGADPLVRRRDRGRGSRPVSEWPWAFGRYSDGTPIEPGHRRLYRDHSDLQKAFPEPYDAGTDRSSYLGWCKSEGGDATRNCSRKRVPAGPKSPRMSTQRFAADGASPVSPAAVAARAGRRCGRGPRRC